MRSIVIESPGLLTTVQDRGRYGYQRFGMPVSGAMDVFSLLLANKLVGNHPDAACLETTIIGPEILFSSSGAIAICGADMGASLNGKSVPCYKTLEVEEGDLLSFKGLKSGCRSYIAFAGGIDVPEVMGSRSTYIKSKSGGKEGRALRRGDEVHLGELSGRTNIKTFPGNLLQSFSPAQTIRIIPGPEVQLFEQEAIVQFLTSDYSITDQSDRMGYRLSGTPLKHKTLSADIISAGISFGTIQITGDGQPIVLMADRQTTGGYTRIANVISVDHTLLAQLKPGDKIRFSEVSLETARHLFVERQKLFEGMGV